MHAGMALPAWRAKGLPPLELIDRVAKLPRG